MQIKKPIFINGFQRGGTNIFVNLIASHPQVSTVGKEMHEVFYGVGRAPLSKIFSRLINAPLLLGSNDFYKISNYEPRKSLPSWMMKYSDLQLNLNKIFATENYRKAGGQRYTLWEVYGTRIVVKNVNGAVLISKEFEKYYPDAVFISVLRNGLALCEGFVRRGWTARDFGLLYQTVSDAMLEFSANQSKHLIVKFEELLENPQEMLENIYRHCGLPINQLAHFRMHAKASMNEDGHREFKLGIKDRQEIWLERPEINSFFRKEVNQHQIKRLTPSDRDKFLEIANNAMEKWGYL